VTFLGRLLDRVRQFFGGQVSHREQQRQQARRVANPRQQVRGGEYRCGFHGCGETFSTFTDLHVHVQRVHVRKRES
jgi:hypothetical protein